MKLQNTPNCFSPMNRSFCVIIVDTDYLYEKQLGILLPHRNTFYRVCLLARMSLMYAHKWRAFNIYTHFYAYVRFCGNLRHWLLTTPSFAAAKINTKLIFTRITRAAMT